nr:hypothetical protein Itr_chr14CG12670 [Ipomoea trifida]GLL46574.1 hypothetical protein Itr_chr14CG12680 [Ipomoea trifida]
METPWLTYAAPPSTPLVVAADEVSVYIIKMGAEMGKVTVSGDVESETLIRTLKLRSLKIALRKSSTLAKLPSPSQMKLAYTY